MKRSRKLSVCLTILLCLMLSGCAKGNSSDKSTFTYWIPVGVDTAYYATYDQNPGVKYLSSKTWGEDDTKLNFEFVVPVTGQESSNFNTLLSTGEYTDIMWLTYYNGTAVDLYEEGIALDLTDYVNKYMPNYKAFLEAHPDLARTATNIVDGEKKYLQINSYTDGVGDSWGGYCYRRDWIVKYGTNPNDGSPFSGSYTGTLEDGSVNMDSWEDNVVFPSGGNDPVYISDWEWMFEIFTKAMKEQNITDGYCMSLYYPGYMETGDLLSGFGGGGGTWYKTPDDKIEFGATSDSFRTYLQCMKTWFDKGWIDKAFSEHSSDMFYSIDSAKVAQGKVGLWFGMSNQLEGRLDSGEGYTDGAVVFAARQPMNDRYGSDEQKNKEPYCMFQAGGVASGTVITDKAKDKDLPALFAMLDYMYTPEGSLLATFGLNKEQYEETNDEFYTKYGLTEGSYYPSSVKEDGTQKYTFVPAITKEGGSLVDAVRSIRIFALDSVTLKDEGNTPSLRKNLDQWIWFKNSGYLDKSYINQLSQEDTDTYSKIQTNVREFMSKNVPKLIKGENDPFSDEDWNAYKKAISKYKPETNTQIYQNLLDRLIK